MKLIKFIGKWWESNQEVIGFILPVFLLWQIFITGIIFGGQKYIPSSYQYTYVEQKKIFNPLWLWSRANFDGIHYLDIARKGYGVYQQDFFPLYPKLINWLAPLFQGRDLVVGWGISLISLFGAMLVFYKLVRLDYKDHIARRTILYLLIFPTAFFFSMIYTEALFFFLVVASFYFARNKVLSQTGSYFARTKKWWLAGIFGALASATRLAGIFLLPALLVELWQQNEVRGKLNNLTRKQFSHLLAIGLVPLGLVWYMRFLSLQFGDSLMFLHVQKIILLYQVFWRYLKMLWTVDKLTLTYFVVVLEFLAGLGFLGLLGLAYRKKVRLSYLVFAVLSYIAPTLTGTFSSMPRYVLTLFPCFIMMALIKSRFIRYSLFVISFLLFLVSTILFSQGYWVA